ncbi:TPA: hypothetical protein ACX6SR_003808 [Photobacterium damselae]
MTRYLRGETTPDIHTLGKIVRATRFNLYWLLFGDSLAALDTHSMVLADNTIEYRHLSDTDPITDGFYLIKDKNRHTLSRITRHVSNHHYLQCANNQMHVVSRQHIVGQSIRIRRNIKERGLLTCDALHREGKQLSKPIRIPLPLYLDEQGLSNYPERLIQLVNTAPSITMLANKTKISRITLSDYALGKNLPDIERLSRILNALEQPFESWLFPSLASRHLTAQTTCARLTVSDDWLSPNIPKGCEIEYRFDVNEQQLTDHNIYVIASPHGLLTRKIKWDDKQKHYLVTGDNPHYPPQTTKEILFVGQVTAILLPPNGGSLK